EVVTPDGAIWNGLRAVQKDNAGYQLRKLYCGAEGTLGIVTRAILRLYPMPRRQASALVVMPDFAAAVSFGTFLRGEAGEFLTGLEFFSDIGLGLALKHLPDLAYQLEARGEVYVLVELASGAPRVPLDEILASALEWGMEQGLVLDGALAATGA
ncbi:MAG: FAD-binding oxidoreductase, partial [Mesorhizobium sp.]